MDAEKILVDNLISRACDRARARIRFGWGENFELQVIYALEDEVKELRLSANDSSELLSKCQEARRAHFKKK